MNILHQKERSRFSAERSTAWLWYVGAIRIVVLVVIAVGVNVLPKGVDPLLIPFLTTFYLFGIFSCVLYLFLLHRESPVSPLLTWGQMLIDFGIVAATVNSTGGADSLFTFLFVVVILEAGLLLGIAQGFVFATLATLFMGIEFFIEANRGFPLNAGYAFLVQTLAYYLTTAISGYWNMRLNRLQEFQHEILDNMNNGFIIVDPEGCILVQNKAAARILEIPEGAAVGQPVENIIQKVDGDECPVITALRTRRDFTRYEFAARIGENKTKTLGLSTSCLFGRRGNLTGLIVSFSDLTELTQMREELQRHDRLAAVGELAAGLAHEIRNPIAAIRGAMEEIRSSSVSPEQQRRLIEIAVRESDHLNHIISQFLDFAREPHVERTPFPVCEVVREVCELLSRECHSHPNIEITMLPCPHGCAVSGDRSQLKQVFYNIGKNALEAMEQGGRLTVAIVRDPVSVSIRFDDEGPGIPPDQITRIFEPFYTTKQSGVGMGLAVCMRIVTAHDGAIYVASRPTGGASFTVRLPAVRSEE